MKIEKNQIKEKLNNDIEKEFENSYKLNDEYKCFIEKLLFNLNDYINISINNSSVNSEYTSILKQISYT